ncbi:LmeA family phospholipid-binding protein [Streptomyces adonidis]|uniref:LmeA family phospholipid-binding protein n=1 Tax=Streptomyces adonidis TaxID=3231367 RepID=UPI0034DAED06
MRRRWVKVLLITVVVLAALFTAADRVGVHYADKEVTQLAKEKYGYANTTDGNLDVSIEGFPFLTQAAGEEFGHVSLTAHRFYIDTTNNAQGGYLHVDRLHLDLRDVRVTSLTARSAEANLATGTLTISYKELSGVVTRLAGNGGPLQVSRASGSNGQAARVKVAGTVGGTALNATGTLLAQGTELSLTVPGVEQTGLDWRVGLPQGVGFASARATADGVEIDLVGHQVTLGSSRFDG